MDAEHTQLHAMGLALSVGAAATAIANAHAGNGVFTLDSPAPGTITCRSTLEGMPVELHLSTKNFEILGLDELLPKTRQPSDREAAIASAMYDLAFEAARGAPAAEIEGAYERIIQTLHVPQVTLPRTFAELLEPQIDDLSMPPPEETPRYELPKQYRNELEKVSDITQALMITAGLHKSAEVGTTLLHLLELNNHFLSRDNNSGSILGGFYSTQYLAHAEAAKPEDVERASMYTLRTMLRDAVVNQYLVTEAPEIRSQLLKAAGDLMRIEHADNGNGEIHSDTLLHRFALMEIYHSEAKRWADKMSHPEVATVKTSEEEDALRRYATYTPMIEIVHKTIEASSGSLHAEYAKEEEHLLAEFIETHPGAQKYFNSVVQEYLSPEETALLNQRLCPNAQKLALAYRNAGIAFTEELCSISEAFTAQVKQVQGDSPSFRESIEVRAKY